MAQESPRAVAPSAGSGPGRAAPRALGGLAAAAAVGVVAGVAWAEWRMPQVASGTAMVPLEQLAAITARLAALERGHARPAGAPVPMGAPAAPRERFILAMLHLQAAAATARPWLREYDLAVSFAPPGALSPAVSEVLASHAARGLASEAALAERFDTLAPALLARTPAEGGLLERLGLAARGTFSALGLATPPPTGGTEAAVQRIREQLRRGQLAAALHDAATLDPAVQPLLSGWLAQARGRLAVEQAIQETLLRAMGGGNDGPA